VKLIFEALAGNSLPFINGGEPVPWAPHISPALSLIVVISILAVTVVASLLASRRAERAEPPEPAGKVGPADDVPGLEVVAAGCFGPECTAPAGDTRSERAA